MAKHSFTYRFSAIVLGVISAVAAVSCMPRGTDEAATYAGYVDLKNVNFSTLSAAVLIPKCNSCHKEFSTQDGLDNTLTPNDPENSELYQMVASGKMPKNGSPLTPTLVQMIRVYIENVDPALFSSPVIDLNHVDFSVLHSDIFVPRCLKCHDEFAKEDGVLGDVEPGDPEHSLLYNYVLSGRMPKKSRHLTDNNIAAIAVYINSLPPVDYPPIEPTWNSINANMIQRSCIQCHSEGGSGEKHSFKTYAGVVKEAEHILKKIQNEKKPMPPKHTTLPPTPELIQAFSDWIKAGTPEN